MALTAAYYSSIVSDYIKNNKGKNGSGVIVTKELIAKIQKTAERLKIDFLTAIHQHIKSFPDNAINISYPDGIEDGEYAVTFSFDKDALWRDSLCQNKERASKWRRVNTRNGKYGTDNIVLQFEKGWNAKGQVFGKWKGRYTWSRTKMDAQHMLADTVSAFNNSTPDYVSASLKSPYN